MKQYLYELSGNTPEGMKTLTAEQQKIQSLKNQLWRAKRYNKILKRQQPSLFEKIKSNENQRT